MTQNTSEPPQREDPAGGHLSDEEPAVRASARPDHHDPTAGFGGAAPAASALTLRLVLAGIGLVVCAVLAIWFVVVDAPAVISIVLAVLAVMAAVDIIVVARRKHRGEPG